MSPVTGFCSSFEVLKSCQGLLSQRIIHLTGTDWPLFQLICWYAGLMFVDQMYHQTPNIKHTFVGNKTVDHSDVFGASPVSVAPTTSSFSTEHPACKTRWEIFMFCDWVHLILDILPFIQVVCHLYDSCQGLEVHDYNGWLCQRGFLLKVMLPPCLISYIHLFQDHVVEVFDIVFPWIKIHNK